jgi:O-antigen/teichoic acid export membrane protein
VISVRRLPRFVNAVRVSAVNPLVAYAALYVASAALLKLVGFVLLLWLARTLSVEAYANFGLLYALQTGIATLALAGIVEAVVGLLKERRSAGLQNELFAAANQVFLVSAVIGCVVALVLWRRYAKDSSVDVLTLVSVLGSGVVLAFSSLQSQIVRLEEKHIWSLCFNFVAPLGGFLGGMVGFLAARSVRSFFFGSAVGASIALLALWMGRVGFYGRMIVRGVELRPLFVRLIPFVAIAFLGWLSGYGNNYIVKLFFRPAEVAAYTLVFTLSSILQIVATAMNQVWSPRFYRIVHELPLEEVEKKNRQFFGLQAMVLGIVGATLIVIFPSAMRMLGGNLKHYQSMSLELGLLVASYVLLVPWWHCQNYFLAFDMGPSVMRVVLITSVVGIAGWLILMWLLGPVGIYVGFLAQMVLRSAGLLIAAKGRWPLSVNWRAVAGGLLITVIGFVISRA